MPTDLKDFEVTADEEKELLAAEQEPIAEEPPAAEPAPAPAQKTAEPKPAEVAKPAADPKPAEKSPDELRAQIDNLNRALREARHEHRSNMENFKAEFQKFREGITAKDAPKPPDPQEDPLGHQQFRLKELDKQQEVVLNRMQGLEQQHQLQQAVTHVTNLENQFRQAKPDYDAAFKHLMDAKTQELAVFGINDPAVVAQEINRGAMNISMIALRNGKNPAEIIYDLARQAGYAPPKPAETSLAESPIAALEAEAKKAAEHLATVEKGQQASKALKGDDVETEVSYQALLKAEGADFDKLWKEKFGE